MIEIRIKASLQVFKKQTKDAERSQYAFKILCWKVGEEIEGCGGIQGCGWSREK